MTSEDGEPTLRHSEISMPPVWAEQPESPATPEVVTAVAADEPSAGPASCPEPCDDAIAESAFAESPVAADGEPSTSEPTQPAKPAPVLPFSPSELASFGDRGALRPVPGKIPTQPTELLAHVPDTAVEWFDRGGLSVRGVSVRGHVHRYEGSVRQDQLAVGEVGRTWVLAVSDGLGSQANSHLGAALASRFVVGWAAAEHLLDSDYPLISCAEVAGVLLDGARQRELDPRTVSATLTFAVVDPRPRLDDAGIPHWRLAVAQIGDSHAYLLRDGVWSQVTPQGTDDAMANVVDPLPKHTEATVVYLDAVAGDLLALTSDGVGILLEDQPEFAAALAGLWVGAAPSPAALLFVVDGSVKSYDDDRTFLGIRFGDGR